MIDRLRPHAWRVSIISISGPSDALAKALYKRLSLDGLRVEVLQGPACHASQAPDCSVLFISTPVTATESGLEASLFAIIAFPEPIRTGAYESIADIVDRVAKRIRRLR